MVMSITCTCYKVYRFGIWAAQIKCWNSFKIILQWEMYRVETFSSEQINIDDMIVKVDNQC